MEGNDGKQILQRSQCGVSREEIIKSTKLTEIYLGGRQDGTFFRLDQEWTRGTSK